MISGQRMAGPAQDDEVHMLGIRREGAIARPRSRCIRPARRAARHAVRDEEIERAMTTFNEREKGFEQKYKHDQELRSRSTARRNKLLGLWAAEQMGLSGADAEAYAKQLVQADFEKPGDSDVVAKIVNDLSAKGRPVGEPQVRKELDRLFAVAKEQIMKQS